MFFLVDEWKFNKMVSLFPQLNVCFYFMTFYVNFIAYLKTNVLSITYINNFILTPLPKYCNQMFFSLDKGKRYLKIYNCFPIFKLYLELRFTKV